MNAAKHAKDCTNTQLCVNNAQWNYYCTTPVRIGVRMKAINETSVATTLTKMITGMDPPPICTNA